MVAPDTVVVGVDPHDMTEAAFTAVLVAAGSPAAPDAHAAYMALGTMPVSIAFVLAISHHDSSHSTAGINALYGTRNPGNCRSSRTGVGVIVNTSSTPYAYRLANGTQVPADGPLPEGATALYGGKGPFVVYPNYAEGFRDIAWRLIDPTYVYAKEGRTTIRQIITRFAPKEDNNSPESYIAAVVADMNAWSDGGAPMTGDMPGVPFIAADARHYTKGRTVAWPDLWIFHHTNGYDSLGWLTTNPNSDVSATLLLNHDGTTRAQLVRFADTPHTTGKMNPRSLSSEWERKWPEQSAISDEQYANIADSVARALLAERARGNPFWQGIPPRSQFADHNDYYNTTCPGNLSVDRLYGLIIERMGATPTPPADPLSPDPSVPDRHADENPYGRFYVPDDIAAHIWDDERECGFLAVGFVVSGAYIEDDHLVVYTERRRYERHRDGHIYLGLVGLEAMKARQE